MIVENANGSVRHWTFGQLLAASSRLGQRAQGQRRRDGRSRRCVPEPGRELTLCHLAGYRMGAVVLPLFTLFGEEALEFRMANAEAKALITDMEPAAQGLAVRERLPHLKTVIVIGAGAHGAEFLDWDRLLAAASDDFATVDTKAEDPALLIYTSGHHRPAQGRTARPSCDAGLDPAGRAVAQPLAARQRGDVDAGRMGLDRRALRCTVPRLVLRQRRCWRIASPSSIRARLRHARQAQGGRELHPADGAQDDAPGP